MFQLTRTAFRARFGSCSMVQAMIHMCCSGFAVLYCCALNRVLHNTVKLSLDVALCGQLEHGYVMKVTV